MQGEGGAGGQTQGETSMGGGGRWSQEEPKGADHGSPISGHDAARLTGTGCTAGLNTTPQHWILLFIFIVNHDNTGYGGVNNE